MNKLTPSQAIERLFVQEVNRACVNEQVMNSPTGRSAAANQHFVLDLHKAFDKRVKLLEALNMLTANRCL